jgi:hypothetical protein
MPSIAAACRQFRFQDRPLLLLSKRPSVRASVYALTTIRVSPASLTGPHPIEGEQQDDDDKTCGIEDVASPAAQVAVTGQLGAA